MSSPTTDRPGAEASVEIGAPEGAGPAADLCPTWDAVLTSETGGRERNEDCACVALLGQPLSGQRPLCLMVLGDGMGGHEWGDRLSREAVRRLAQQVFAGVLEGYMVPLAGPQAPSLAVIVAEAVELTAQQIRRVVEANRIEPAGTTLVAALLYEGGLAFGHLGDSRLYHYRQAARQLVQLTQDHSVVAALLEAGMIQPAAARHHASRHQLEYYAGAARLPVLEPHEEPSDEGDIIMACSDGISAYFTEEELGRCFASDDGLARPLLDIASRLHSQAIEAGVEDNRTVILVRFPASDTRRITARMAESEEPLPEGPRPASSPERPASDPERPAPDPEPEAAIDDDTTLPDGVIP